MTIFSKPLGRPVLLDGREIGSTPLKDFPVAAGGHVVALVDEDQGFVRSHPDKKKIVIIANQAQTINWNWGK